MTLSRKTLYGFHVENLRAIEASLKYLELTIHHAIASQKSEKQITYFCRFYALDLGIWAEARLNKLLYEPGGFTDDLRLQVLSQENLYERWLKAISIGFRKKYGTNIPATGRLRQTEIIRFMDEYLKPIITVRNRLAHGQWIYPLNTTCTDLETNIKQSLENNNILHLQFKRSLLSYIASVVHDLVVSKPAFERDFDKHFRSAEQIKINIETRSYPKYVSNLIKQYQLGQAKRATQ